MVCTSVAYLIIWCITNYNPQIFQSYLNSNYIPRSFLSLIIYFTFVVPPYVCISPNNFQCLIYLLWGMFSHKLYTDISCQGKFCTNYQSLPFSLRCGCHAAQSSPIPEVREEPAPIKCSIMQTVGLS